MTNALSLLKNTIMVVTILFANASVGYAQDNKLWQFAPPSPTSKGMTSVINFSPSKFTGKVNVSIPVYTAEGRELKVPISLSYSSSGVKVDEESGWTGLGWSLSAGGVINRTMYGLPDEDPYGYCNAGDILSRVEHHSADASIKDTLIRLASGKIDLQPDLYGYSAGAIAGNFVEKKADTFFQIPRTDATITRTGNQWTIVGPDGTSYMFGGENATEKTICAGDLWENIIEYNGCNLKKCC